MPINQEGRSLLHADFTLSGERCPGPREGMKWRGRKGIFTGFILQNSEILFSVSATQKSRFSLLLGGLLAETRLTQHRPLSSVKSFLIPFAAIFVLFASSPPVFPQFHEIKDGVKGISLLDAVRNTLRNQPAIQIQQEQVNLSKGVLQETSGQFDWNFNAGIGREETTTPMTESWRKLQGLPERSTRLITDKYRAGFDKQMRSGITVSPGVDITHSNYADYYPNTDPSSQSSVNFRINVPLLKGRGVEATGAPETAAALDLESTRFDYKAVVSKSILETTAAYWNLCTARERLEIYKDAEAQARSMLELYRKMVDADVKPFADLDQLKANLSDRAAQRISGESEFVGAQQRLWLAMGMPFSGKDVAYPLDFLPDAATHSVTPDAFLDARFYVDLSRKYRPDLLSLKRKEDSALVLLKAAEINKSAKLDLVLGTGYSGLWEGGDAFQSARSLDSTVRGLNVSAGLEYRFPIQNNSLLGVLQQRRSVYRQATLRTADLDRNISSQVTVVLDDIKRVLSAWNQSTIAVKSYEDAVRNEDKKMRMGMSTLMDLIVTQDKLRDALLNALRYRQVFAELVVNLRYSTGTIVSEDGDLDKIDMKKLITLPNEEASSHREGG